MEGKLITTTGLTAYTQQLKTWIGDTYQTKADMDLYKKTDDLFTYLDTRYIAKDSPVYCNPIYKHIINVMSKNNFSISLTIFTTRATRYKTSSEFKTDWVDNGTIISVLAKADNYSTVPTFFNGTVVGVASVSGSIAVRISGIESGNDISNWDQTYTINKWDYLDIQQNPCRI